MENPQRLWSLIPSGALLVNRGLWQDSKFALPVLLLLTLVVRVAVVVQWYGDDGIGLAKSLSQDTDSYLRLAVNLSQSGTYGFEDSAGQVTPTAFRPPLYPWLLSWFASGGSVPRVSVACLNVFLGVATVFLTWSVGRAMGLNRVLLAAVALAVDPLLLRASQSVMTETLAAFFAILIWRLWLVIGRENADDPSIQCSTTHRNWKQWICLVGLGLSFGLAILARPTAAPWAALCAASMLVVGCTCWKRRVIDALVVCLGVSVCVIPWTLRNWSEIGKPIWATSHGGYTLLLANNPPLYDHFRAHGPSRNWNADGFHATWGRRSIGADVESSEFWEKDSSAEVPPELSARGTRAIGELDDDQLAYDAAWATIQSQPQMFSFSSVYRIGWFWALWPNQPISATTVVIGIWYAVWLAAAVVSLAGIWRRKRLRNWIIPLLLVLVLTMIHAVFWSNMRMRAPLMSSIYLLAICARTQKTESKAPRELEKG